MSSSSLGTPWLLRTFEPTRKNVLPEILAQGYRVKRGAHFGRGGALVLVCAALSIVNTTPSAAQDAASGPSTPEFTLRDLKAVLGGSVSHDSNVFKLSNAQSDTLTTAFYGLRLDKPYSQQRFQLDLTQTHNRYSRFSNLNFDALDYRAAWLWQVSSRLTGTLSTTRREAQVPFQDDAAGNRQRNVSVNENTVFSMDGQLTPSWHAVFALSQAEQRSEQAVRIQPDFRSVSRDAGLKYVSRAGNSVSAIARFTSGNYLSPVLAVPAANNGYDEDEIELNANWKATANSSLTARLSWLDRTSNNPAQGSFSGPSGDINYSWVPASPFSFNVMAGHRITSVQHASFSHIVIDTLSFSPVLQLSEKTALRMRLAAISNRYGGSGSVAAAGPALKYTQTFAEVGVDWAPMQKVSVSASLQRQSSNGNDPLFGYDATIAKLSALLTF